MIKASLTLKEDTALEALLNTEGFSHPRASYKTIKKMGELIIKIKAKDATALRTVVNSIARVLAVAEKAKKI